jgi:hypothetical protein
MRPEQHFLRVSAMGSLFAVWLMMIPGSGMAGSPPDGTASRNASSPKSEILDKYLLDCAGKPGSDGNCEKLRISAVEILKEDLHTLGSTANRAHLPLILRMFWSEEPELRMAAADAVAMIGPQDQDVEVLAPLTNDSVPDVRHAVANMLRQGKGKDLALLKERTNPLRNGGAPEKPVDAAKFGLPMMPSGVYLFDSSDVSVGRLSYVHKNMNEVTAFFKGKAKKGPFPLQEFKDKFRYQLMDEDEAGRRAQDERTKQLEREKPDPTNAQALADYMNRITATQMGQLSKMALDAYQSTLFKDPTVYILEERQIGQRSYPTRYVVTYQDVALKRPGYRLVWTTVPDEAIKTAQATSLVEEKQEMARQKENEAQRKRAEELESLTKKKDAAEKKEFKKGQEDLEKALGF